MQLSRDKFVDWLEHKDPYDVVGEKRKVSSCPIAIYIKETVGVEDVWVSSLLNYRDKNGSMESSKLPIWAVDFIGRVDKWGSNLVTAKEAWNLLKG